MIPQDEDLDPPAPTRERAVAETFVRLADTLVDDYDVADLLDQLVGACVTLLDVAAGGLLLDDQRGSVAVAASSSEQVHAVVAVQIQHDQGPSWDCLREARAVASSQLLSEEPRWPHFAAAALAAGFHSVVAVPLRLRRETIGALNLFHTRPGPWSVPDVELAQALADVATIGLLQRQTAHRSALLAEQLQHALSSRVVIEQAKGVLAERHGVDMDRAFALLRRHARDHQLKLTQLALAVVRGEVVVPGRTPGGSPR